MKRCLVTRVSNAWENGVKFEIGSSTDRAHSVALKHEFLRCEDAFTEFTLYGSALRDLAKRKYQIPLSNTGRDRLTAFRTYNAYTRFVHHLYEFLLGGFARERQSTAKISAVDAGIWIEGQVQRILRGRRNAILRGTAPDWENDLSYFPETVPSTFACDFRLIRNKANGHVTYERAALRLTDFYIANHKYLMMLYWNCLGFWGIRKHADFPDLQEITDFSMIVGSSGTESALSAVNTDLSSERSEAIMNDIWRLRD